MDAKDKPKVDPYAKLKLISPDVFRISNIDLAVMKDFPYKLREGDVPLKVCKVKRTDFFEKVGKKIAEFFGAEDVDEYVNLKYDAFDMNMTQIVFEYFCIEFKAAPLVFTKFMEQQESKWYKVTFKNYHLNEATAKAIACLIPFLVNVDEIEFDNN